MVLTVEGVILLLRVLEVVEQLLLIHVLEIFALIFIPTRVYISNQLQIN
jgi:hypothetical protein